MASQTPLAWRNLTHDMRKLAIAISGIGFAVMLMFQQRGFRHALFDSTVAVIQELNADLIISHRSRFALSSETRFDRSILEIAASTDGVAAVAPIYLENQLARFRTTGRKARPIRVIAFDIDQPLLADGTGEIRRQLKLLKSPQTALMDRLSKENYGIDFSAVDKAGHFKSQQAEITGKQLDVVGQFQLGRDFAHDGTLLMSSDNFAQYFAYRALDPLSQVDLGVIRLAPGQSSAQVIEHLRRQLGPQATVHSKRQFIEKEIAFWARNTPIGAIFAIGATMGFVVGIIICYQVLANDITEHLGEFATLKAMGYSNTYFFALVIRQSLYLALLGFLPGMLCSWLLFQVNSQFTGLVMNLSWDRALFVLVLTIAMCVFSGLLALRKLLAADPASLF